MKKYSDCFVTLYDQETPVGAPGRGQQYTIFRALLLSGKVPEFHDFGVVWDADHDERVIWVAENLLTQGLLSPVRFIAESKAHISILADVPMKRGYTQAVESVAASYPDDMFTCEVNLLPDSTDSYTIGVAQLWELGTKPIEYHGDRARTSAAARAAAAQLLAARIQGKHVTRLASGGSYDEELGPCDGCGQHRLQAINSVAAECTNCGERSRLSECLRHMTPRTGVKSGYCSDCRGHIDTR